MKMSSKTLLDGVELKSTYSLDILTKTVCKNGAEVKAIHYVLWGVLNTYQWKYQKAPIGTPSEEIQSIKNNFKKVSSIVKNRGHASVALELDAILHEIISDNTPTKESIVSKVGRIMKRNMVKVYGVKTWRYEKHFAKRMKEAFKEQCSKYQLESPNRNIDINFKVPKNLKIVWKKV